MTDWLEELLERVRQEEPEEAEAEILSRRTARAGGKAEASEEDGPEMAGEAAGTDGLWDRRAEKSAEDPAETERPGRTTGQGKAERMGRQAADAPERRSAFFGRTARRAERARAAEHRQTGAERPVPASGGEKSRERAVEQLYRRLARAERERGTVRSSVYAAPAEQQSAGTPSLTVDLLDRAVRQDSRRYDGGMELY